MEQLHWIDIALLMSAGQGFFLAVVFLTKTKGNRAANRVLGSLLVVVSLSVVLYITIFVFQILPYLAIAFLDTFAFLYAPLIYVYFQKLLAPSKKYVWQNGFLYAPALLHLWYAIYLFSLSEPALQAYIASGGFRLGIALFFSALLGYTFICMLLALREVYAFQQKEALVISYRHNLTYLFVFLGALGIGYVISILFALHTFFEIQLFSFINFYLGWMLIPCIVYGISYVIINYPEVLHIEYRAAAKPSYTMPRNEQLQYQQQLVEYLETSQAYLNPKLTLQELAMAVAMTPTKLSKLINTTYACNFYDFINQYRIAAFVEKLNANEHETQTFIALAYDVGFNSKTTFNKVFKKTYQTTPSAYVKRLQLS